MYVSMGFKVFRVQVRKNQVPGSWAMVVIVQVLAEAYNY